MSKIAAFQIAELILIHRYRKIRKKPPKCILKMNKNLKYPVEASKTKPLNGIAGMHLLGNQRSVIVDLQKIIRYQILKISHKV